MEKGKSQGIPLCFSCPVPGLKVANFKCDAFLLHLNLPGTPWLTGYIKHKTFFFFFFLKLDLRHFQL